MYYYNSVDPALQHLAIDIPVLLLYVFSVFAVIVLPCIRQTSRHINSLL